MCGVVAIVGIVATVTVAAVPALSFAFAAPVLRAVLETVVTMTGGVVASLMIGRYRRSGRGANLATAIALGMLSLAYPVLIALPATIPAEALRDVGRWIYLIVTCVAACLLWWASGRPATTPAAGANNAETPGRLAETSVLYTTSAVALTSFVLLLFFGFDPDATLTRDALADQGTLFVIPSVSAVRLLAFVFFLGAAIRLSSRRQSRGDYLIGWMSVGCAFLAVGNLDSGLFPTIVHSELHLGDVFRLAGFLIFAVGATAEIHSYWYESREFARLEERRLVARELHDGVAQELAFLRSHALAHAGPTVNGTWLRQLRASTDRALAESRRAISALVADQPLSVCGDLEETVREVASNTGVAFEVDVQPCRLTEVEMEVLIRIVREAVINAVRHGRPRVVSVRLGGRDVPVLRVVDDGVGFDVETAERSGEGFGLVSMRERARSIGARLIVDSRPGGGTTVEVSWAPLEATAS